MWPVRKHSGESSLKVDGAPDSNNKGVGDGLTGRVVRSSSARMDDVLDIRLDVPPLCCDEVVVDLKDGLAATYWVHRACFGCGVSIKSRCRMADS